MSPDQLATFLSDLVENRVETATMIWGPPGIGKSSVVAQVCKKFGMDLIDLRISQLAPTDLRGLPVPHEGTARWLPPNFLPRGPARAEKRSRRERAPFVRGVLFLDEFNMAAPVVQGIAQQLVLDKRVGDYVVPDGWFIWAAGNRKEEDRAAVNAMPAPLANRFLHLFTTYDHPSFRAYMIRNNFPSNIILFLEQFPDYVHKLSSQEPAWPSPRSWEVCVKLLRQDLPISSAVGPAAEAAYESFVQYKDALQINGKLIVQMILDGEGKQVYFENEDGTKTPFPKKRDLAYTIINSLALLPENKEQLLSAGTWVLDNAPREYLTIWATLTMEVLKVNPQRKIAPSVLLQIPGIAGVIQDLFQSGAKKAGQFAQTPKGPKK
jgi:hypothetical protein